MTDSSWYDLKNLKNKILPSPDSKVVAKEESSTQTLSSSTSLNQSQPVEDKKTTSEASNTESKELHVDPDKHRTEHIRPPPIDFSLPERFFLWLSKTDLHAAWIVASTETVMTQQALGWMVLSTGIFAFMSSYYAIHSAVLNEPGTSDACLAALIALFYSCAIVMMDREIISNHPDGAVTKLEKYGPKIARVVFSAFLGIVLSFPIELKVLDGAIQEQIGRDLKEVNAVLQAEIDAKNLEIKQLKNLSSDPELERLHAEILEVQADAKKIQEDMDYEKNQAKGTGPKWAEDQEKLIVKQQKIDALNKQFQDEMLKERQDPARTRKISDLEKEIAKSYATINKNEKNAGSDLLLRARALHHLEDGINTPRSMLDASKNDEQTKTVGTEQQHSPEKLTTSIHDKKDRNTHESDWTTILIVNFLRMAFVLFEVLPVLIKISMAENEYHAYISCRRSFARQKMFCYTNKMISEHAEDPTRDIDYELSDYLERAAEDPTYLTRPHISAWRMLWEMLTGKSVKPGIQST